MNKRILIVEDDKSYQKILQEKLEKEGFQIVLADDGEMALNVIKNVDNIDLIILDLLMPKMDGQTFYYHLRNSLKDNSPVIVLTNLSTAPYDPGVAAFFVKTNISLEELITKIKEIFAKEEREREK
ncbi:MAG TPA: response regulator [Patescibacteria group bacterium]